MSPPLGLSLVVSYLPGPGTTSPTLSLRNMALQGILDFPCMVMPNWDWDFLTSYWPGPGWIKIYVYSLVVLYVAVVASLNILSTNANRGSPIFLQTLLKTSPYIVFCWWWHDRSACPIDFACFRYDSSLGIPLALNIVTEWRPFLIFFLRTLSSWKSWLPTKRKLLFGRRIVQLIRHATLNVYYNF